MATTTIRIEAVGDLFEVNLSSVPIVAGDTVTFEAPASGGARLCMNATTAQIFDPPASPGMTVPAGGSAKLQFAAGASGAHAIGVIPTECVCPSTVRPGTAQGALTVFALPPSFEGTEQGTESGTRL
jgi:hypothetical protein